MKAVAEIAFSCRTPAMTRFLEDILRQPIELQRTFDFLRGEGRRQLEAATEAIGKARHVYLTGIGSSWHAALTASPLFAMSGRPVYVHDASELLQFATIPAKSVLIVISRSGQSIEIVQLLVKAREAGAFVIGITNSPDGTLARESQIPILIAAALDHAISVNTYTTLAAAAGALASTTGGSFNDELTIALSHGIARSAESLAGWQEQIADAKWLSPGSISYFLGRGSSLGSCHEARLLWEEGVKSPATAMGTGGFRHGPQEMVAAGVRFGIWIDGRRMRGQDLALARDLVQLHASVMLIGQDLPKDAADLVFNLPTIPAEWQFLIDVIPAQLVAEHLARLSGVDSDTFRLCSFIVEDEGGLLPASAASPKHEK
jgi:glucosamine--fructose-6-phosphate aminotransferase (isomerizing)